MFLFVKKCYSLYFNERDMSKLYEEKDYQYFIKNKYPLYNLMIISDYENSPFTRAQIKNFNILPIICYFDRLSDYPVPKTFQLNKQRNTLNSSIYYSRYINPFSVKFVDLIQTELHLKNCNEKINILNYIKNPENVDLFFTHCTTIKKMQCNL